MSSYSPAFFPPPQPIRVTPAPLTCLFCARPLTRTPNVPILQCGHVHFHRECLSLEAVQRVCEENARKEVDDGGVAANREFLAGYQRTREWYPRGKGRVVQRAETVRGWGWHGACGWLKEALGKVVIEGVIGELCGGEQGPGAEVGWKVAGKE